MAESSWSKGSFTGRRYGAINYAGQLTDLELGLINYAESAENGIQIGILNIMNSAQGRLDNVPNEVAPGMVFMNRSM